MRATLLVVLWIAAGCSQAPPPASPPVRAAVAVRSPLLTAVGPAPRGFASLSLAQPWVRQQLAGLDAEVAEDLGKTPSDCGMPLDRLERVRIAIGEPLRVAAEIDGDVHLRGIRCLIGDAGLAQLVRFGLVVRDRPGGIAIEYRAAPSSAGTARATGSELALHCNGDNCGVLMLGPAGRRLWVEVAIDTAMHFQLSGPSLGSGAAVVVAAFDGLRAAHPELGPLTVRAQRGALIVEAPLDLPPAASVALALTLRQHLIEAFKVPSSSMVPTLLVGDHIFAAKGALLGRSTQGDILTYHQEDRIWVKRYLAGPGQTIAETSAEISINGALLRTEPGGAEFHYLDADDTGDPVHRVGPVVREHLGGHSYLTVRTGPPHVEGSWTVAPGHVFLVGDNRNNSNDSRYLGATPETAVTGRVIGIWFAMRDGVPDWDRIGVPVE